MFFTTLFGALAEFLSVLALLLLPPKFFARAGSRWMATASGAAVGFIVFHGKQVFAGVVFALATVSPPFVASDAAYCRNFSIVTPGFEPVDFHLASDIDSGSWEMWEFNQPPRFIDTTPECSPDCFGWLAAAAADRTFVSSNGEYRPAYPGTGAGRLPILEAVPVRSAHCTSVLGAYAKGSEPAQNANGEASALHWDPACFVYRPPQARAPLLLTTVEMQTRDVGLGLSQVRLATVLREQFSGKVLARSDMVMLRGIAPTFLPLFAEHEIKGRLLTSHELLGWYRDHNC